MHQARFAVVVPCSGNKGKCGTIECSEVKMIIKLELTTPKNTGAAWRILTDWQSHGDWIPFTTMIITKGNPSRPALGDAFIGRSGIWPIRFDDVMTVTDFRPPSETPAEEGAFCEVTKTGRLIKGRAYFEVHSDSDGSIVTWVEEIAVPPLLEKLLGGTISTLGQLVFRRALTKALC